MAVQQQAETLANAAYEAGEFERSIKLFRTLLRARPRDAVLLHKIGMCYGQLAQSDHAVDFIQRAIDIEPTIARWHDLAGLLQTLGRLDEAWAACESAHALEPDEDAITCIKAAILNMRARFEDAYELLAPLLERPDPPARAVAVSASVCRQLGRPEAALEAIERCLAGLRDPDPDLHVSLLFNQADLLHGLKRYAEAFESYDKANRMKAARNRFDPDRQGSTVERIIETWTADAHRKAPRSKNRNDRPVFVLGMPRSGTSLVEQILSCHPKVYGGGERPGIFNAARRFGEKAVQRGDAANLLGILTPRDINDASREYLKELPRAAGAARRITDKMTLNFLFLGLIALMLPKTRIIHCVRDPLDTCLSCYFQNFFGSMSFAWDLGHLGRYYRSYEKLMTHWKTTVDVPILDVAYEDLVDRPEQITRGMVDHLDLEWNDACLDFHASERLTVTASIDQVRRPMYRTSVGRHKVYDEFLGPLREGLAYPV